MLGTVSPPLNRRSNLPPHVDPDPFAPRLLRERELRRDRFPCRTNVPRCCARPWRSFGRRVPSRPSLHHLSVNSGGHFGPFRREWRCFVSRSSLGKELTPMIDESVPPAVMPISGSPFFHRDPVAPRFGDPCRREEWTAVCTCKRRSAQGIPPLPPGGRW